MNAPFQPGQGDHVHDELVNELFETADVNRDDQLAIPEIIKFAWDESQGGENTALMTAMQGNFAKADGDKNGYLDRAEARQFVLLIAQSGEL